MCPWLHSGHLLQCSALCGSTSKHPHSSGPVQTGMPHQEASVLLPLSSDRLRYSFPALHHLCWVPARDGCFSPRRPHRPAARGQCRRVCCQPRLHLVHRTPYRGPVRGAVPPLAPPTDQLPGTGQKDHCRGAGVVAYVGRTFLLVVRRVEGQPPSLSAGRSPHMDTCYHHLLPAMQHLLGAELFNNPQAEDKAEAAALPRGAWASAPPRKNHGHAAGAHLCVLSSVGSSDCCSHLPPVCFLGSPGLACPLGLRPVQHAGHAQHGCQLFSLLLRQQAFPQRRAGHHAAQRGAAAPSPASAPASGPHQRLQLVSLQWEQQTLAARLHPLVTSQKQKALVTWCFPPINPKHPSSHGLGAHQTPGASTAFQPRPWTVASQPWSSLTGLQTI